MRRLFPLSTDFSRAGVWSILVFAFAFALVSGGCRTIEEKPFEEVAVLDQAAFASIDKDADGKVSVVELAAHKHREGLAEIDLDSDSRVSPTEWAAARPNAADNEAIFDRLDSSDDSFLDEKEAVDHVSGHPAFTAAFRALDRNGDGFLIWEEYAAGDPSALNVTLIQAEAAGS